MYSTGDRIGSRALDVILSYLGNGWELDAHTSQARRWRQYCKMAKYERPTPLLRLCGIDSLPAPAHQIAGSNVVRSSKEGVPRKGVPEGYGRWLGSRILALNWSYLGDLWELRAHTSQARRW